VARAVGRFEFRLVIHERPNKWRPVEQGHALTETHVFDRNYTFAQHHRRSSRWLRDSTHAVQVKCILLSNEQCVYDRVSPCKIIQIY
jgi:hypothetical protein